MTQGKKKNALKVKRIHLKDVYGIDEIEVEPGQITEIEGWNGAGKSSLINSIGAIFGKTNVSKIQNIHGNGKPKIAVVLESDDVCLDVSKTSSGLTVKKRIDGSAAMEKLASPQGVLKRLFDGQMANPMKFLTADKKERVTLMLEAMTLPYSFEILCEQIGLQPTFFSDVPGGIHPLVEIGLRRANIFKTREGVNRDAKSSEAAAQEIRMKIPAKPPVVEGLAKMESDLKNVRDNYTKVCADSENKRDAALASESDKLKREESEAAALCKAEAEKIEQWQKSEIEKLNAATEKQIDSAKKAYLKSKEAAISAHAKKQEKINYTYETEREENDSLKSEISTLVTDIAVLREKEKTVAADSALRQQVAEHEDKAETLKDESVMYTRALNALDDYKAEMCANLPIDGLEILDGNIFIDGVEWDMLNTATQLLTAFRVAKLRCEENELKIMWIDGAESLDAKSLDMLKELLVENDIQGFIASVRNSDLTIKDGAE